MERAKVQDGDDINTGRRTQVQDGEDIRTRWKVDKYRDGDDVSAGRREFNHRTERG